MIITLTIRNYIGRSQTGQGDQKECVLLIAKWQKTISSTSLENLNETICFQNLF